MRTEGWRARCRPPRRRSRRRAARATDGPCAKPTPIRANPERRGPDFLRPDLVEGVLVEWQQRTLDDLSALDAEDANGLHLDRPAIPLSLAAGKEHRSIVVRKDVVDVHVEGAPPESSPLVEVVDHVVLPYVIARDCTATWHVPYDVVRQHRAGG